MLPLNSSRPTRIPWALGAIVLLLAGIATLFSEATVSLASSGKYIRLCMAAMPNGDHREQGGEFTFHFFADGDPVPFATLTMDLLELPDFHCEDVYPSDYGISDSASFVVSEVAKPSSWESAPGYPKHVTGNPPLQPGPTTAPFTISAQLRTVYFYDQPLVAARAGVCKGLVDNGDGEVDTGTFEFTVAVKGQAPFTTVSVSAVENQEEECEEIFLEDVGLSLPVTLVVTELPSPGFVNAPGYPRYYDTALGTEVEGTTVELAFDADNRELYGWFMNQQQAAPVVPEVPDIPEMPAPVETPAPAPTPTESPSPTSTATQPPAPTSTATPPVATPAPEETPTSVGQAGPASPSGGASGAATPLPPRTGDTSVLTTAGSPVIAILMLGLAVLSASTAVTLAAVARRA